MRWTIVSLVLFLPAMALADVLHLDDGSVLHGRVVSSTESVVVFETAAGTMEVPRARIRSHDVTPAASPTPVPTAVWESFAMAPATTRQAPPPKRAGLQGRIGAHAYGGSGWSGFEEYRSDFTSLALEVGMSYRAERQRDAAVDVVGSAGFHGGNACIPDSSTTCATISLANWYVDAGPRLEIFAGPLGLYGQVGAGLYASVVTIDSTVLGYDSNSRTTLSGHVLGGAALELDPSLRLFGELKWTSADGRFPGATRNWDMGGATFFVGGELRL